MDAHITHDHRRCFGVIIYFFIKTVQEKLPPNKYTNNSICGLSSSLVRNSISFCAVPAQWKPFSSYINTAACNRFLTNSNTLVSDAFVLFFISDIALSICLAFYLSL